MKNCVAMKDDLKKYLIPAFERKAASIVAIDVKKFTSYTDTLVIIEGNSKRQVTSIAQHLIKTLKGLKIKTIGAEGVKEGEWALLDYGDVIIHVFESAKKSFYDVEGLWADAPRIDLTAFKDTFKTEE
ncbi:MAG: ribosome silencing factor [Desulfobacula sp.]|jgi:ribosome-associated protein|uniref:ribosome silencing factor n=1 Tax=Desulfobacula sp. TaxID=2593537 RepID=UPI001D901726|nr:ribosome silencing factor [Desulfobacula sp.]MBT3487037.1 ribosome silencing factor [Desulfobacula sp.]MBT3806137.1 ribosome silencing factor [Desulfobacula sp.]MBT4026831.1 ribosome silencing factor [Desulfobacula sp.]MBT4199561.1 ribosome silencing factor [Desulfobacula sp.]